MEKFTADELNLMCIYDTGSRAGLMEELAICAGISVRISRS